MGGCRREAIAAMRNAESLDPLSAMLINSVGVILYGARKYYDAAAQYRRMLQLNPQYVHSHAGLARVYAFQGKYDRALEEARIANDLTAGEYSVCIASLGIAHALAGQVDAAKSVIDKLQVMSKGRHVSPCLVAMIYACLGRVDEAFTWLEKGFEVRDHHHATLLAFPEWEGLYADPRFVEALERVGLADCFAALQTEAETLREGD
jgi:serine/threonine-protein kinase